MKALRIFLFVGLLVVTLQAPAQTVLRTEFQDTQPKFIFQGGAFSGLCLEIMGMIERRSDIRFTYPSTFVPIGRIIENLRTGGIDVYFGLAKTAQREKDLGFVAELFRARYQILARKDDALLPLASLERLKALKVPVLVIRGSAPANYYEKTLGLPVLDAPTSVEMALRQLKAGKGRLFGYYDLGNDWYLDTLGYRDSLTAALTLDDDGQWLCVSPTLAPELREKLRKAFEAVRQSPEWAALMRKYFPITALR